MVWNQVTELPFFWKPFYSFTAAVLAGLLVPAGFALLFGFLAFPQPNPRRLFRHHHAGSGAHGLARLQSE